MTRPRAFALCLAACLIAPAVRADVVGLPVTADRCAIAHALTGHPLPGCAGPVRPATPTRSVSAARDEGYFVQFDFGSNALTPAAMAHLQRLSGLLNGELSRLCIKLVGHTDTVGAASYNMTLSARRAKSAHLYMAGPGRVDPLRLSAEGQGELRPLPGMPGEDGRNRRVEILAREGTGGSCS